MSDGQIRPLEFGELLDKSFSLYRSHFLLMFLLALIPRLLLIPTAAFNQQPFSGKPVDQAILANFFVYAIPFFLILLLYFVVSAISTAATVVAASEIYMGREITIGEAYRRVGHFWGRLFNVWFSIGIRIFGAAITLILIPLIPFLLLWWAFSVQIVLFEQLPVGEVLKRSRELTKGSRMKIFVTGLLMTLLVWVITIIVTMPVIFLQGSLMLKGQPPPLWLTMLSSVLSSFAAAVAVPPMMIAITLLYYNTRVVKEGYDLQLMLDRLGPEPAA